METISHNTTRILAFLYAYFDNFNLFRNHILLWVSAKYKSVENRA